MASPYLLAATAAAVGADGGIEGLELALHLIELSERRLHPREFRGERLRFSVQAVLLLLDLVVQGLQQFIQAVVKGRNLDRDRVLPVADGRILTGEQALQLRLVDQMGNLQDTVDKAAELAKIAGKPNVIYPKKKLSLWGLLAKQMANAVLETLGERGFQLSYRIFTAAP